MGTAKKSAVSDDRVALYDKLIATNPTIERKGAANPYTSLNGNMFTLLHQSRRLAIRLAEDKRAEFLKKYETKLFEGGAKPCPPQLTSGFASQDRECVPQSAAASWIAAGSGRRREERLGGSPASRILYNRAR